MAQQPAKLIFEEDSGGFLFTKDPQSKVKYCFLKSQVRLVGFNPLIHDLYFDSKATKLYYQQKEGLDPSDLTWQLVKRRRR